MKKRAIVVLMIVLLVAMGLSACAKNETEPTPSEEAGATDEAADAEAEGDEAAGVEAEGDEAAEDAGDDAEDAGDAGDDASPINVIALKGPTAMGMVEMMSKVALSSPEGKAYSFQLLAAPDEVAPLIIQGKADIAAVPANLASVIYNKTEGGVQVLNINTLGVIYIVEKGETVSSASDLAGKTIFASGQGATPEYALRFILSENGIDPDNDVNIEWKSEHAECLSALLESEGGVAMLPQPFVTAAMAKAESLRVALDLTDEWAKTQEGKESPSTLLTGVTIVRKEFAEAHPELVASFMEDYKNSVEYVNANVEEAAKKIEAFDIVPAAIAEKAIPSCNIVFIDGIDMKVALEGYLSVLAAQNPQAIGGALPSDDFYR